MLGMRVRSYRKKKGLTLDHLAKKIGITASGLSDIENNKINPSLKTLESFIAKSGINATWLFSGKGEMFSPTEIKSPLAMREGIGEDRVANEQIEVEVVARAGLGNTYEAGQEPLERAIMMRKAMLTSSGRVVNKAVRCSGDSMYPTIVDNALVGVDFEDRNPGEGKIFKFRLPQLGFSVKQLGIGKGGFWLTPDNRMFQREFFPVEDLDQGLIAGRVRWVFNKV